MEIRFTDSDLDESPNTIAYVLLALMSISMDCEIAVIDDFAEEIIVIRDEATGYEYLRLRVSPMMGTLLISILNQTGVELAEIMREGDEPWISKR